MRFCAGRRMFEDDQLRFIFAALADGQQNIHPQRAHGGFIKDGDFQPNTGGHCAGAFGKFDGMQHISRLADIAARRVHSSCNCAATGNPSLNRRNLTLIKFNDRTALRATFRCLAFVVGGQVSRQEGTFGRRLRSLTCIKPANTRAMDNRSIVLDPFEFTQRTLHRGRSAADTFAREFLRITQPNDQDPRGRQLTVGVEQRGAPRLAGKVGACDQLTDRAAQGFVDGTGSTAGFGHPFKQINNETIARLLGKIPLHHIDFHDVTFLLARLFG